jgi:hypothetical protein
LARRSHHHAKPSYAAIEQARANPDAWNARRDDNISTGLRGRS